MSVACSSVMLKTKVPW